MLGMHPITELHLQLSLFFSILEMLKRTLANKCLYTFRENAVGSVRTHTVRIQSVPIHISISSV
jgi:hypothetical protein